MAPSVDEAAGHRGPPVERVATVSSTQDLAARYWDRGRRAPFAVLAAEQTAGRGRLGRSFASPPGGSLSLTVAHRSRLAPAERTWFPLVTGLAVIDALTAVLGQRLRTAPRPGLKWPNDIHTADGRKLGGILVEGRGTDGVLVGVGLNVSGPIRGADGSALDTAAWLLGAGGLLGAEQPGEGGEALTVDVLRERLGVVLATRVTTELEALESTGGDAAAAGARDRYTMTCLTLGQAVRVDPRGRPGAAEQVTPLHGTARGIDGHGALMVATDDGREVAVDVGDVRHVRPGGTARDHEDDGHGIEQEEYRQ